MEGQENHYMGASSPSWLAHRTFWEENNEPYVKGLSKVTAGGCSHQYPAAPKGIAPDAPTGSHIIETMGVFSEHHTLHTCFSKAFSPWKPYGMQ